MYIKNSIADHLRASTWTLPVSATSALARRESSYPTAGLLPADLSNTTGAAIVIMLQVGLTVNILLTVEQEGKKYRYPVKAVAEEIDHILGVLSFSIRTAKPGTTTAWSGTAWDFSREAISTGSG